MIWTKRSNHSLRIRSLSSVPTRTALSSFISSADNYPHLNTRFCGLHTSTREKEYTEYQGKASENVQLALVRKQIPTPLPLFF